MVASESTPSSSEESGTCSKSESCSVSELESLSLDDGRGALTPFVVGRVFARTLSRCEVRSW